MLTYTLSKGSDCHQRLQPKYEDQQNSEVGWPFVDVPIQIRERFRFMIPITDRRALSADGADWEDKVKRQIFEKVAKRMDEFRFGNADCAELNPDVIVISGEQTMLFEPQNLRVVKWLHRRFGMQNLDVREQIHIHPARCQILAEALRAEGFEVSGWNINQNPTANENTK